jgi:thiol-disulfide isomerase/thioredoxin
MLRYIILSLLLVFSISGISQDRDSITVYYFLGEDCKICQYYTPTMNELYEKYNSEDVSFIGLFPNHFSSPDSIDIFKQKYAIPFTLKKEFFLTKTKEFDVKLTPEVVVYNETTEEIMYQGRIDNSYYKLGRRRQVVTSHELRDVLRCIVDGREVDVPAATPIGCLISFR